MTRPHRAQASLVVSTICSVLFSALSSAAQGTTERVSISSEGAQANKKSSYYAISGDGRFVAFVSEASNLVPGDTNQQSDVFVRDRQSRVTERVSVSSTGGQGNRPSGYGYAAEVAISHDGRFVAFYSHASNLVDNDSNGFADVFVRDRLISVTELVSVSTSGEQANGESLVPSLSADGRYVAFRSDAGNLVPVDTNRHGDVFVRDRWLGTTERVSISTDGEEADRESLHPVLSGGGRFVAFRSAATNLVPGDTNGMMDIFLRDRALGITERVSVSWAGQEAMGSSYCPSVSYDGRFVSFQTDARNLVPFAINHNGQVYVRDRLLGTTEIVSVSSNGESGDRPSWDSSISADGRFVAFDSAATNLVPGDTNYYVDVFVRDRLLGTTVRASVSSDGHEGNRDSGYGGVVSISADGRLIAFDSEATNLVDGDTNWVADIFVYQIGLDAPWPTVSGQLVFEHWSGPVPAYVLFELRRTGTAEAFGSWCAAVESSGSFALPAPFASLDLSLKHMVWLRQTHAVSTENGDAAIGVLSLVNGDAKPDNRVDLMDLNSVLLAFGRSGTLSDLDGSGTVDAEDLVIVLMSFARSGDP